MDDERRNMDIKARDPFEYWSLSGKIVPADSKSSALSMFPIQLKSILLQRCLTCEGFLACQEAIFIESVAVYTTVVGGVDPNNRELEYLLLVGIYCINELPHEYEPEKK